MIQYEKIELDYHLPIKLLDIYFEDHNTKTAKHYHNSVEILIPVLGNLNLFINTESLVIPQGELYIVNSQEIHGMYHSDDTEIYKGYALQINYSFIKKYFPAIDHYVFIQPSKEIKQEILKDIYRTIDAYDHHQQFQNIEIESYILHLLFKLLSNLLCKKTELPNNILDKRIIKITQYIDLHYDEDLSIDEIAQHFHISPGYLSRYFKSHLNMTIKEYLISVRLKEAQHDLLFSDYSILEISLLHGFPNLKSFINAFKKVYHDTPAKYREKVRKRH